MSSSVTMKYIAPDEQQAFHVIENRKISPDSNILKLAFSGRKLLGWKPLVPTCISVSFQENEDSVLKKSYSPISHPSQPDTFDLLVKAYEPRPGGGVGDYICSLQPGDVMEGAVKKERVVHGSSEVVGRGWKHVGLVAGGTGIAPHYQILQILLRDEAETQIQILSINRHEQDILLRDEMDTLSKQNPKRLSITYSLTDGSTVESMESGRGSVDMIRRALPDPTLDGVMVFVCGKDGFVEAWGGRVCRAPPPEGKKKGPKIQGPLLGLLKDAGYSEEQVFKY